MTELTLYEATALKKQDVEWLFACCAFIEPLNTLAESGFVSPADLDNFKVRKFWEGLLAHGDQFKAAQDADCLLDLFAHQDQINVFDAKHYAYLIKRASFLTQTALLNDKLAKAISRAEYDETRAIIEEMGLQIPFAQNKVITATDGFEALIDIINQPQQRTIKTYIPPLDSATGGLERQTLSVLAARPQMGKSTLAWQIAQQVVMSGGRALFVSLEMSAEHLYGKAACGRLKIRWTDVINNKLSEKQKSDLTNKAGELMGDFNEKLLVMDDPSVSSSDVWLQVSRHQPDMVFIDHLALLADEGDKETLRLGQISWRLKAIAKQFNCHVMCLAQLNRGVEYRSEQRPRLSDLRDSGKIEENADSVFMLYRADYYKDQAPNRFSETELLIRKSRYDVANGRAIIQFDTAKQWFGSF